MIQGQSYITEEKARGLTAIFKQQLSVFSVKVPWQAVYLHIDMHAGCGWNHDVGVIGSPVLFAEIATEMNVPFFMVAVEKNKSLAHQLEYALSPYRANVTVIAKDNADVCDELPGIVARRYKRPDSVVGSVLIDPNTPHSIKSGLPWGQFANVFQQFKRMDALFNFPGTSMKRIKHYDAEYVCIADVPRLLNKPHWMIRKPMGSQQFTMLVGRQCELKECKNIDLVNWNSEVGMEYRKLAELTTKRYQEWRMEQRGIVQGELF